MEYHGLDGVSRSTSVQCIAAHIVNFTNERRVAVRMILFTTMIYALRGYRLFLFVIRLVVVLSKLGLTCLVRPGWCLVVEP